MSEKMAARLVAHGALVFLAGLAIGIPFAFSVIGSVELWPLPWKIAVQFPGDYRAWRMAHLEGLLNGITLIAVAAVAPKLPFTERGAAIVGWGLIVTAWGNWIASAIGPILGGRGLQFGGGVPNDAMYVLFVVAMVAVVAAMVALWRAAAEAVRGAKDGR